MSELVQVGWYCDHGETHWDEVKRKWTTAVPHIAREWRKGEWKNRKKPGLLKSLSMLDHHKPDEVPPCPLSVPIYRKTV